VKASREKGEKTGEEEFLKGWENVVGWGPFVAAEGPSRKDRI